MTLDAQCFVHFSYKCGSDRESSRPKLQKTASYLLDVRWVQRDNSHAELAEASCQQSFAF